MTTAEATELTGTYTLDPAHTRLGFVAHAALVTKARGVFENFAGRVYLDFAAPERSTAEVTVDVAGLNTRNKRRDQHLLGSFFDLATHPRMVFRSTGVHPQGDDRYLLSGELTIKDRTRPVALEMTYTGADDGDGNVRVRFTGQAVVDRRDWGVAWNRVLEAGGVFVSNTVTLDLEVTAVRSTG